MPLTIPHLPYGHDFSLCPCCLLLVACCLLLVACCYNAATQKTLENKSNPPANDQPTMRNSNNRNHSSTAPILLSAEVAPLWRRIAAMVYDLLITMTVAMTYGALFITIKYRALGTALADGERASMGPSGFVGLIIVTLLFYGFFWHRGGQTLGMRAWRLQLLQPNGQCPSWSQSLARALLAPLSFAAAGIGYFWCLYDSEGKTLHDRATNTCVIVLPKTTPQ